MVFSVWLVLCFLASVFASPCNVYFCSDEAACKEGTYRCGAHYVIKYGDTDVRGAVFDLMEQQDSMFYWNRQAACEQLRRNAVFWKASEYYERMGQFNEKLLETYRDLPEGFYYERYEMDIGAHCVHLDQFYLNAFHFQ